jgi:AcrR family transcriptional regulator
MALQPIPDEAPIRKRRPERLEAIVDAAIRLFGTRGYQATSLEDVAGEVGLAPSSLYRHVRSKLEILEICLDRASSPLLARVGEIARSGAPPERILGDLADNLIEVVVTWPGMAAVLVREYYNLPAEGRAFFERSQRLHIEEWVHVLVQVRPDLTDNQARLMVRAVLAMLHNSTGFVHDVPADQTRAILHRMTMAALLESGGDLGTGTSAIDREA